MHRWNVYPSLAFDYPYAYTKGKLWLSWAMSIWLYLFKWSMCFFINAHTDPYTWNWMRRIGALPDKLPLC